MPGGTHAREEEGGGQRSHEEPGGAREPGQRAGQEKEEPGGARGATRSPLSVIPGSPSELISSVHVLEACVDVSGARIGA